jgi:DNA-binding MarR family transcriptional regulator
VSRFLEPNPFLLNIRRKCHKFVRSSRYGHIQIASLLSCAPQGCSSLFSIYSMGTYYILLIRQIVRPSMKSDRISAIHSSAIVESLKREIRLNREFESHEEVAFLSIAWTWRSVERLARAFLSAYGLTDARFNLLMILYDYRDRPLRHYELADLLVVNRASAGSVVVALERLQLVKRTQDACDRRSYFVQLTPAGHETLLKVREPYYALLHGILEAFSPAELTTVAAFCHQLRQRLTALQRSAVNANINCGNIDTPAVDVNARRKE